MVRAVAQADERSPALVGMATGKAAHTCHTDNLRQECNGYVRRRAEGSKRAPHAQGWLYIDWMHLTPEGNRIVARAMADRLVAHWGLAGGILNEGARAAAEN